MTLAQAESERVRCPDCGGHRLVARETACRIRAGTLPRQCRGCRKPRARGTERHRRWWLEQYGMRVPVGTPVVVHVAKHGLPAPLVELVASLGLVNDRRAR